MANIYAKGNDGSEILFDFDKRCIKFTRHDGFLNAARGLYDIELPFDEVTAFVIKDPTFFTVAAMYVVINDTMLTSPVDCYLTEILVQSSGYKKIKEAIQRFCAEVKSVPVHSRKELTIVNKKGTIDLPMVKYAQKNNPYETETREIRMRCNVCGKIYCFNKEDLERNRRNEASAKWSTAASVANAVGGTSYHMYEQEKMANAAKDRIVD